jgi:hypothetical protein
VDCVARPGADIHDSGVFVRSSREKRRARLAVKASGVSAVELSDKVEITPGSLSIGTMHLAKGSRRHRTVEPLRPRGSGCFSTKTARLTGIARQDAQIDLSGRG